MDITCNVWDIWLEFVVFSIFDLAKQGTSFCRRFCFVDGIWKLFLVFFGNIATNKVDEFSRDLPLLLFFSHRPECGCYINFGGLVGRRCSRWPSITHTLIANFIRYVHWAPIFDNPVALTAYKLSHFVLSEPLELKSAHYLVTFIVLILRNHYAPIFVRIIANGRLFFLVSLLLLNHGVKSLLLSSGQLV